MRKRLNIQTSTDACASELSGSNIIDTTFEAKCKMMQSTLNSLESALTEVFQVEEDIKEEHKKLETITGEVSFLSERACEEEEKFFIQEFNLLKQQVS
jgi:hypothetical protein